MADLESQLAVYTKKLSNDLEDLQINPNFSDGVESLYRDANIYLLLTMAIAMSPDESPVKSSAEPRILAAQKLAAVTNLKEAKAAYAELLAAEKLTGNPIVAWSKVAHLSPIMKKGLPAMSTEIKRLTRNEKTFTRPNNAEKVIGASAALAVIALGSRPNVAETLAPNEEALWQEYCDHLHAVALALNKTAHAVQEGTRSFADLTAAFHDVDATCNTTCHEKFGGTVTP